MDIWSAQDEATLVQLVIDGAFYRVIAVRLNKSVNAVCAKVKRMRDQKEIPVKAMAQSAMRRIPKPQKPVDTDATDRPIIDYAGFKRAVARMEEEAIELKDKLLTLEELPDDGCHYVTGDPRETNRVYCNCTAVPGKPYCEKHLARMFNAATVTTRVKIRQPMLPAEARRAVAMEMA